MTQYFLGIVVETDNLAVLRSWATEKSLEAPIIRPLVAAQPRKAVGQSVELNATAFRVFEYWRTTCNHPRAVPGNRLGAVKARLREGFTEAQLREAIDGAAKLPTVNETTNKVYDDLELVCRNASKVEDFIERAKRGGPDQKADLAKRFG